MANVLSLAARVLAATACVSMMASPALAAALPQVQAGRAITAPTTWSPANDRVADGRGGWGGHGGWGGRHHHDDGIDAGDVFAGLLILGGIAAIASAASSTSKKSDDEYRYRDAAPPEDESGWQGDAGADRGPSSAMNRAVDACVSAVGREGDVDDVYGAQRSGNGYQVGGRLAGGKEFTCNTGADGWVNDLVIDGREVVVGDPR